MLALLLFSALIQVGSEKCDCGLLGEMTEQTQTVRPLRPGDRPQEYTLGVEWDSFRTG